MPIRPCVVVLAVALSCSGLGCGFGKYKCRSKQSEAKANLRALVAVEQSIKADKGKFTASLAALKDNGLSVEGARYQLQVVAASDNAFTAEAHGVAEMAADVWRVDQSGVMTAVSDACQ
jgi:hypothetical protein